MADDRLAAYAALLVERCVDVQPGWQVQLVSAPAAAPLVAEVERAIGRRGAYALTRLELAGLDELFQKQAPLERVAELAPIDAYELEHADCLMTIEAPENTRDGSDVPTERVA